MPKKLLLSLFAFSLLFIVACGFEPMYATKTFGGKNISSKLSQVSIANIPDREGQLLRNALYDRFYRNGKPVSPQYNLTVSKPTEIRQELDITIGAEATRAQLRLFTDFTLTNMQTGKTILRDRAESIASFNIIADEYATRVSESNTRENALRDIARQIEQKVTLKLNEGD